MSASPSYEDLMQAAQRAHRAGDADGATGLLRRAIAQAPTRSDAPRALALLLQQAGRGDEAVVVLEEAIATGAGDPALHFSLGLAQLTRQRWEAAVAAFDAALEQRPDAVAAHVNRGVALRSLERIDEAIAAFTQAARLAPQQPEGAFNLGICLLRRGRAADAVEAMRRAAAAAPSSAAVQHGLGNALRASGELAAARQHLERALALDPRHADASSDLGMCLLAAGEPAAALPRFRRALALAPSDQNALAGLYLAANECGEGALAAQLMDYPRLLGVSTLAGADDVLPPDARAGLVDTVLALPGLSADPYEKTTRGGEQSPSLPCGAGEPFAPLAARIGAAIDAHLAALEAAPGLHAHPWWAGRPPRWRLTLWATVLHAGGHQRPHLHPAGWLSGVCYLQVGALTGEPGCLEFGRGHEELPLRAPPLAHLVAPAEGELLLFPSYFLHRTLPWDGGAPRISIAFDLVPD